MKKISPLQLKEQIGDGTIVDVRTPAEFDETHVTGSRLCPLDKVCAEMVAPYTKEGPVYVMCGSGKRATRAIEKLSSEGVANLVLVEGGIEACGASGLPFTRGRKTMPLERQVRIAAGALVCVGAILGFGFHPYWHGLSAFVGAGLIFAGVSGSCAMGMLMAKMPWNRRQTAIA